MAWSPTSFDCIYYPQPFLAAKVVLATCGVIFAVFSIVFNISVLLLASHRSFRHQYLFHGFVAVSDVIFAVFFLMYSAFVLAEYYEIFFIFELWHTYAGPCIALGQIGRTASTNIILAMAVERVLIISNHCKALGQSMQRHRWIFVLLAIAFSVLFKISIIWEMATVTVPGCVGFARIYTANTEIAYHPEYNIIWRMWTRNIATIIAPFIALLCCFVVLVCNPKSSEDYHKICTLHLHIAVVEKRDACRLQTETHILLLIVAGYLLANMLNVAIAVYELVSIAKLNLRHELFYVLGTDVVSVLTILVGALRLSIYVHHDQRICRHLRTIFRMICFIRPQNLNKGPQIQWTVQANFELNLPMWSPIAPESPSQVAAYFHRKNVAVLSTPVDHQVWEKRSSDTLMVKEIDLPIRKQQKIDSETSTAYLCAPCPTVDLYSTEICSCPLVP